MFVGMWHSFSQRISNLTASPSCTQTNVPQIAISPGIRELEHRVVLMVVVREDFLKEAMMFRRGGGNIHYVTMGGSESKPDRRKSRCQVRELLSPLYPGISVQSAVQSDDLKDILGEVGGGGS